MTRSYLIPALALAALLPACVPAETSPGGPLPGDPSPNACGAMDLQYLVGEHASVLDTMRFGQPVRVIRPGTAVTMDFNAERLNFTVDARERISRVACG